jgi:hypothetical protein
VLLAGAHGIPIAACRPDLAATSALEGIVRSEDDRRARRQQQRDEPSQQHATPVAGRPGGPMQDPLLVREAAVQRHSHHAQGSRHRPRTRGQHRSQE